MSWTLDKYRKHVSDRAAQGVVPKPLTEEQVTVLVQLLKAPPAGEEALLLELIRERVPPGVDPAAKVKCAFLTEVVKGTASSPLFGIPEAIQMLGQMVGGYNVITLIDLLETELAPKAVAQLKKIILVFDYFELVAEKARKGNTHALEVLNRMLLVDTAGTGGDSHTRFPIGISFPAGSGLVAFAAATGCMPLDMPESVLVRFTGSMQPGVTLRDLVNAIPYFAIKQGLLTVAKAGKKNCFNGRILEIEGLPDLKVEQAFELSDASAERSAGGCTVRLNKEPIQEYLKSNLTLLRWMISQGYADAKTLEKRARKMEEWLAQPDLLQPDDDAEYAEIIVVNMDEIKEPILACPNDPDDVKLLSEVQGSKIDEVFVGSCMTNIGHYRAVGKVFEKFNAPVIAKTWICPPTKMDAEQLIEEGFYGIFGQAGARTEIPGCSLCMGNQARVAPKCTVVSTSTRNFPNRLGDGADVYLSSAEVAAVTAILGRLPTVAEYMQHTQTLDKDLYRYLNFNEVDSYASAAERSKKTMAQTM
eukprot:NODE_967_length_1737_cov_58.940994_g408_i1.p1 GENE.NODE_967_length_1737_cov_58.940994_g408_i1~~NODE_967_length_1737_cov_58.940994_g408_i1.p1  ORF type:complete len:531 (+),score=132.38 NODE_967_length_1737_cov_58.940994_g408_i1:58-1650(+)